MCCQCVCQGQMVNLRSFGLCSPLLLCLMNIVKDLRRYDEVIEVIFISGSTCLTDVLTFTHSSHLLATGQRLSSSAPTFPPNAPGKHHFDGDWYETAFLKRLNLIERVFVREFNHQFGKIKGMSKRKTTKQKLHVTPEDAIWISQCWPNANEAGC